MLVFSQGRFTEDVRRQLGRSGVHWQSLVWVHGDVSGPAWNKSYLAWTTHEDVTVFYRAARIKTFSLFQGDAQQRFGTSLFFEKPPQRPGQVRADAVMKPPYARLYQPR